MSTNEPAGPGVVSAREAYDLLVAEGHDPDFVGPFIDDMTGASKADPDDPYQVSETVDIRALREQLADAEEADAEAGETYAELEAAAKARGTSLDEIEEERFAKLATEMDAKLKAGENEVAPAGSNLEPDEPLTMPGPGAGPELSI